MTPEIEQLAKDWPMCHDLKLKPDSTCVFVGMYVGRAAELIEEMYAPKRVVGFDPQLWALKQAQDRSDRLDKNWELYPYAVWVSGNGEIVPMGEYNTDGCSLINVDSRERGNARIYEIGAEFIRRKLMSIDFFLLNAEGAEYELLPYMARIGMLDTIGKIAVQFHTGLGNAVPPEDVYALMWQTHVVVADDFPRWVLWERR